jgi:hypothetical protein
MLSKKLFKTVDLDGINLHFRCIQVLVDTDLWPQHYTYVVAWSTTPHLSVYMEHILSAEYCLLGGPNPMAPHYSSLCLSNHTTSSHLQSTPCRITGFIP